MIAHELNHNIIEQSPGKWGLEVVLKIGERRFSKGFIFETREDARSAYRAIDSVLLTIAEAERNPNL